MRFVRKTHYGQDIDLFEHKGQVFWYALLLIAIVSGPLWLDRFLLGELSLVFIYAVAGIGLMLLVGYTGQVSLGHAAFLAIGAYTHAYLLNHGWPWPAAIAAATALSAPPRRSTKRWTGDGAHSPRTTAIARRRGADA